MKTNTEHDSKKLEAHSSGTRNRTNRNQQIPGFYCKRNRDKIAKSRKLQRDQRDRVGCETNGHEENTNALTFGKISERCTNWIVDSCATLHICNYRAVFTTIEKREDDGRQNWRWIWAQRQVLGQRRWTFESDYVTFRPTLRHVLYIPTASVNYISVSQAAMSSWVTTFESIYWTIQKVETDEMSPMLKSTGHTYETILTSTKCSSAEENVTFEEAHSSDLWHKRLGYFSSDGIWHGVNKESWCDFLRKIYTQDVNYCAGLWP